MTNTKKKSAEQLIMVDARKLGLGLKTTFEGVAMVFDSLGVDAGFDIEEKKPAKAKSVQEVKDETEDPTADTAGKDADASGDAALAADASEDGALEETQGDEEERAAEKV